MTDSLSLIVPLVALFCNVFLFLTFIRVKKTRLNVSFLMMLVSFILWTAGSLFMRMDLYPGGIFWFDLSTLGIFLVPYLIYNFFYCYTNQKGNFIRVIWLVVWAVIIVLSSLGFFFAEVQLTGTNGAYNCSYRVTWFALVPVVAALLILLASARMVIRSIRRDGIPFSNFTPIFIGIGIMFVGVVALSVLDLKWISSDSLFCGINAVCLYYALYKKRTISLTQMADQGPTYLMAISFSMLTVSIFYEPIHSFLCLIFADEGVQLLVFAVLFCLFTGLLYLVLHRLMEKLFVDAHTAREEELKSLTNAVNKTLDKEEIIGVYKAFLKDNFPRKLAYICAWNEKKQCFAVAGCTDDLQDKSFTLSRDNPLMEWLEKHNQAITLRDFMKTPGYRSMWETEKNALHILNAELILPLSHDGKLEGVTIFTRDEDRKNNFSYSEINFLEAAGAVMSIAFKNAVLYDSLRSEARRDALTELYNRGYFLRRGKVEFEKSRHDQFTILLISFDDFRLFNELYGSSEGDDLLIAFARILRAIVGAKGSVARYGGKEFIVSMPFGDVPTAQAISEECRRRLERYLKEKTETTNRFLTFSAGICSYPSAAADFDETVAYANMAVQTAKRKGKNRTVIYARSTETHEERIKRELADKKVIGDSYEPTIFALAAAIDAKDHYTFNHSNNVSTYGAALARAIGLDSEHVEIVRQAGLLHDIGKIGIPDSILSKKDRLTDEEYGIMKQHVEGSIAMIRHLPSLEYVIPSVIGHHERWDGKGYPRGIAGENIPIGARCLGIADAFDAMTTNRIYRRALSVGQAVEEIRRGLGTQFDPRLGQEFIRLVESGIITVSEE